MHRVLDGGMIILACVVAGEFEEAFAYLEILDEEKQQDWTAKLPLSELIFNFRCFYNV